MPAERYCVICGKSLPIDQSSCPHCGSQITTDQPPDRKVARQQRVLGAFVSLWNTCAHLLHDSVDEHGKPFGFHTIARIGRSALRLISFVLLVDFKENVGSWLKVLWPVLYYSFFPLSMILGYIAAVEHWSALPLSWFSFWRWPFDLAALPMDILLFLLVCISTTALFFLLDSFLCYQFVQRLRQRKRPGSMSSSNDINSLLSTFFMGRRVSLFAETAWKFCDWRDRRLLSGIVDEIAYRWIFFCGALLLLAGLNYLCFGAIQWLYFTIAGPVADLITFHLLHPYLYQSPWTIGAAMLIAQGQFLKSREFTLFISRSQVGWQLSPIRSLYSQLLLVWFPGMFFFLFLFKYGLLPTILLHLLYDLIHRLFIVVILNYYVAYIGTEDVIVEGSLRK